MPGPSPANSGPLVILRHAQSAWNAEGLWQGQADPELSPDGRRQASAAGKMLAEIDRFEHVLSSDLRRAVQTATIFRDVLGIASPVEMEPGMREYDVGQWSGKTRPEIEALWPGDIERFSSRELAAPPGGETRQAFDARVSQAALRVARWGSARGSGGLLVVAHGGVVRALARMAGIVEYRVGHLAGYRGRYDADGLHLEEPIDLLDLQLAQD